MNEVRMTNIIFKRRLSLLDIRPGYTIEAPDELIAEYLRPLEPNVFSTLVPRFFLDFRIRRIDEATERLSRLKIKQLKCSKECLTILLKKLLPGHNFFVERQVNT